jgi:RNA polymerase primary sigma factor
MISSKQTSRHVIVRSPPTDRKVPPTRAGLSIQEEYALAGRIADGDREARNCMVEANLGLVGTIAHQFYGRGLAFEDLMAEGYLGLIRGAEEFDPRFKVRFSTYACYWIKQAMRHALINTTATIRLPAHMVGRLTKWRRAERALRQEGGRAPSFDEVALFMGLSKAQKVMVTRAFDSVRIGLENSQCDRVGNRLLSEVTDRHDQLGVPLETEDERAVVWQRMEQLNARERTIVVLRFGLEGETLTLKEIGHRLGLTREWVRKIEIRALGKLKHN